MPPGTTIHQSANDDDGADDSDSTTLRNFRKLLKPYAYKPDASSSSGSTRFNSRQTHKESTVGNDGQTVTEEYTETKGMQTTLANRGVLEVPTDQPYRILGSLTQPQSCQTLRRSDTRGGSSLFLGFTLEEMSRLRQCVICHRPWTASQRARAKVTHLKLCSARESLSEETLSLLVAEAMAE